MKIIYLIIKSSQIISIRQFDSFFTILLKDNQYFKQNIKSF